MKNYFLVLFSFFLIQIANAQSEEKLVELTLMNYINGSSYNDTSLLKKAFADNATLYLTLKNKEFRIVSPTEYIGWFGKREAGTFNGRIGNILSINVEDDIAIAKAEILMPEKALRYIDLFLLKKQGEGWKIISKTATGKASNLKGDRILFIVSNAHFYGKSKLKTGNSFSELVNAYDTFIKAGYTVDFVSPEGGAIPIAYLNTSDTLCKAYFYDENFIHALKYTQSPEDIIPANYKAVHYIGGGSAMFGVPKDETIQKIVMEIYEEHKGIISSVCHGTAGIVHLKTKDNEYLVKGKRVNGYPDSFENKDAAYFKEFPFLIQKTIEERGGIFHFSAAGSAHVEVDGNLVTGQNYLSSTPVALKVIELLSDKNK